jgi:hypothetical protein
MYYTRYVDYIFIIYDKTVTNPDYLTNNMNTNNQINVLDIPLIRKESSIEPYIYRKPTTTDTTINFYSIHPI